MNCHANNENNKQHGSIKHMLMMVLCCALPIIIVTIIPFLGAINTPFKAKILAIVPYLCPIMMLIMMPMMMRHSKEGPEYHDNRKVEGSEVKKLK